MTDGFARPVLHVSNIEASLRLYVDRLGFQIAWQFDEGDRPTVAQVEPETCEVAALDALRAEFEARGVPVKDGHWGYKLLVVDDPDGNQLFFNYPNEPHRASPAPVGRAQRPARNLGLRGGIKNLPSTPALALSGGGG